MKNKNVLMVSVVCILAAGCLANAQDQQPQQLPVANQFQYQTLSSQPVAQSGQWIQTPAPPYQGTPADGQGSMDQMPSMDAAADVISARVFKCSIASSNDYVTLKNGEETRTMKSFHLNFIRNDSAEQNIGFVISEGDIANSAILEEYDYTKELETYRMNTHSIFRKFEIESMNAEMDPTLPLPVMGEKLREPQFQMRYQKSSGRGSSGSTLEFSANHRSIAKMKCNSTVHDVTVNSTSGGEGKAYGKGGARKQTYAINRVHQERWCDSADVEGSMNLELFGRPMKVRCSYSGETKFN